MAHFIGEGRVLCEGRATQGKQVSLKTGGCTLEFKEKSLYFVLQCIDRRCFTMAGFKSQAKFARGLESLTSYTFRGDTKVHRIVMGTGHSPFHDVILIVMHDREPLYYKPSMSHKVRRWYDAFKYVSEVLSMQLQPVQHSAKAPDIRQASENRNRGQLRRALTERREETELTLPEVPEDNLPPPPEVLPDVIHVHDVVLDCERGSEYASSEDGHDATPWMTNIKHRTSVIKRGQGTNYDIVVVTVAETAESEETASSVSYAHLPLSRQKSRSNDDLTDQQNGFKDRKLDRSTLSDYQVDSLTLPIYKRQPSSLVQGPVRRPHIYDSIDNEPASESKSLIKKLQDEQNQENVTVVLRKDHVLDGVVFVEFRSSIWVATWKNSVNTEACFQEMLHIGDQLLHVNKQRVNDLTTTKACIESSSSENVNLVVKRLPRGIAIHMTKRMTQPWGFEVTGNEITEVFSKSPLQSAAPDLLERGKSDRWVITELNHQPVNLNTCGKNEIKHKLEAACTSEVALVIQPKHFIDDLKKTISKVIKKKDIPSHLL